MAYLFYNQDGNAFFSEFMRSFQLSSSAKYLLRPLFFLFQFWNSGYFLIDLYNLSILIKTLSVCHICWKYFWQPFLKSTFYSFLLMCCFVMASLFLNLKLYPHVRKFSPRHIPFSASYLCLHLKTEIFFLLKYSLLGSKSVIIDLKK